MYRVVPSESTRLFTSVRRVAATVTARLPRLYHVTRPGKGNTVEADTHEYGGVVSHWLHETRVRGDTTILTIRETTATTRRCKLVVLLRTRPARLEYGMFVG